MFGKIKSLENPDQKTIAAGCLVLIKIIVTIVIEKV